MTDQSSRTVGRRSVLQSALAVSAATFAFPMPDLASFRRLLGATWA